MKKLALLLLVLPLPALAAPDSDQLKFQQATEARASCAGQHILPDTRGYPDCINGYLQSHYGWQVRASADGSLHPARRGFASTGGNSQAGFGNSSVNNSNQENFQAAMFPRR